MRFKFLSVIIPVLLIHNVSFSQVFPRFSIAGGPTVGWHFNKTDDLNAEMRKIGIPEFPKDGFLTLGGGGFIDLPLKHINWLRLGGFGTGFSYRRQAVTSDNLSKSVYYSFGSGGMTFDYIKNFGKRVEMTLGVQVATGKLTIELYQNAPGFGNWNQIFNELTGNIPSENISRKLSVRFYSVQPQIGLGLFITGFLYAKLNAGYLFSTNGDWKVDDNIPLTNVPSGIKADGFNINFGLNFGLFTK